MDLAIFHDLIAPPGQAALQAASALSPGEQEFLVHFQTLRRRFPEQIARAALEIAILRREATAKFPFAEKLYFTRPALEQASSWEVSTYRTQRFLPFTHLVDLCCSVGGDTLALAKLAPTAGIDLDPLRLAMARANLAALELAGHSTLIEANLSQPLPLAPAAPGLGSLGIFFDPSRRKAGRRVYSVRDYQPPLSVIEDWLPRFPALGVKISPGVAMDELRQYDAEIEFISVSGELKEAVLWFGPLKTTSRRATLLPGLHTLSATAGLSAVEARLPLSEPRAFLFEPDPAILRAGLVTTLGEQLSACQLDPDIAYLTADSLAPIPFGRSWLVEGWFPFGLKRLRAYLRERRIGRVTVKKRGSPLEPESLIHALRLRPEDHGEAERILFLTHLRGQPIVVICFP